MAQAAAQRAKREAPGLVDARRVVGHGGLPRGVRPARHAAALRPATERRADARRQPHTARMTLPTIAPSANPACGPHAWVTPPAKRPPMGALPAKTVT